MGGGKQGARGRRFRGGLTQAAEAMNESISFDHRLLPHDVRLSVAHAKMLAAQGIISTDDAKAITRGLAKVEEALASGGAEWNASLEDVHMNVEAQLVDEIGDAGRRLHTGRSRNDQVATGMRLYARASADKIRVLLLELCQAFCNQAAAHVDTVMPGYTHLQRAQPVRLAHHLMAYVEMFRRDHDRVRDAQARLNQSPLGAGALAATTFPIDRQAAADELGFAGLTANSMDAVSDRDFAVELIAAIALCQVHLSRLGEEIVLWMSQEFSFAKVDESYCSGSSMMPQKVNPDLAELIRAKIGRVAGDWVTLITVLKGLPMTYNKDLQESQEPLYDAVDTALMCLPVAVGMVESLTFDIDRLAQAIDHGHLMATEVADYLVSKGVAFRDAHDASGQLVRTAIEHKKTLPALTLAEFRDENAAFDNDIYEWLDVERALERRDVYGGLSKHQVQTNIARVQALLGQELAALEEKDA